MITINQELYQNQVVFNKKQKSKVPQYLEPVEQLS